mgnify:FL=1
MNGAHINGEIPPRSELTHIDRWILDRLDQTISLTDSYFEEFEFAKGCEEIYRFAWDELCDWYLELIKDTFAQGGVAAERTKRVLGDVFDRLFRIMHPVMPFISQELWSAVTRSKTLPTATWPSISGEVVTDRMAEKIVSDLQRLITEIRRFRSDQGIKTSARVAAKIEGLSGALGEYESSLRFLVRLDPPAEKFNPGAKIEIGEFTVHFDLTGSIDAKAERARLTKDLASINKDRETAQVKLANENFIAKAPMEVVNEIKARLEFCDSEIERINSLLAALPRD